MLWANKTSRFLSIPARKNRTTYLWNPHPGQWRDLEESGEDSVDYTDNLDQDPEGKLTAIAEEMGRGVVNMLDEKLKIGSVPEKLMKSNYLPKFN